MNIITVILFVVALVLFVICTIGVPSPPRFNLMAAGLAFIVLALLATSVHAQGTAQSPEDAMREQRAVEREQRMHRWEDRREYDIMRQERFERRERRARYCDEWRERVRQHPRLILPRECYFG